MNRIEIRDGVAPTGGVAHVILRNQNSLLVKPELEIINLATDEHITSQGWVRGRTVVRLSQQRLEGDDLVLELDGPIVNQVLTQYQPLMVKIPELGIQEKTEWPEVIAEFSGSALPTTEVIAEPGSLNHSDPAQTSSTDGQEHDNASHESSLNPSTETGQPTQGGQTMSRDFGGFSIVCILAALLAAGVGIITGFLAADQISATRCSDTCSAVTSEHESLRDTIADLTEDNKTLRQNVGELETARDTYERLLESGKREEERLRDQIAVLGRTLTDGFSPERLLLEAESPQGTPLSTYQVDQSETTESGDSLFSEFLNLYNARDTQTSQGLSQEEIYVLRAAARYGSPEAMGLLGQHYVDQETLDRESLLLALHYFRAASVRFHATGKIEEAREYEQYAKDAFATHRALLLTD